eukprot:scaffold233971_cov46-Prasinocladus_malaysianus.AAC.4
MEVRIRLEAIVISGEGLSGIPTSGGPSSTIASLAATTWGGGVDGGELSLSRENVVLGLNDFRGASRRGAAMTLSRGWADGEGLDADSGVGGSST